MSKGIKEIINHLSERDEIIIELAFVNQELQSEKNFNNVFHEYFYGLSEIRKEREECYMKKIRHSHFVDWKEGKPFIELLEI